MKKNLEYYIEDAYIESLEALGATDVIPESVESSLILATRLLYRLNIDLDEIQRVVEQARTDHYRRLRSYFHGEDIEELDATDQERLHTVVVPPHAIIVGHRIEDLDLQGLGVTVATVRRAGICGEEPDPGMLIRTGDALILRGLPDDLRQAETRLLQARA